MRSQPRVIPSEPGPPASRALARWGGEARDLLFNSRALALCSLWLVAVFSFSTRAQEPVPLARGNAPGEPHHHLKIENEYVRVYYVQVPPHENTQLHQHDHDYIYVSLGPSDVVNAIVNKPEIRLQLKDGETHFTRGGFAHVARNLADTPFRNITIELLKPQGNARNRCERVVADGPFSECPSPSNKPVSEESRLLIVPIGEVTIKPMFQTDEVFLTGFSIALKSNYTEPDSNYSHLLVAEDKSELRVEFAEGTSQPLHSGETLWLEGGKRWTIVPAGEQKLTRFLLLRFNEARDR
jgi:quercetin dioxygenase-like cupin family protein